MEKMFTSRQSRHSNFGVVLMLVLFPICILTWILNNYVSRQGKGVNRRNEGRNTIVVNFCPIIIISLFILFPTTIFNCQQLDFPLKNNLVIIAVNHYSRRKW